MTITVDKWPGLMPGHDQKEKSKMKITIIKGTYAGGKKYTPGKKAIEIPEKEAKFLIAIGKAVAAGAADEPKKPVVTKEDDLDEKITKK